jgi:hypothetical protein
MAVGRRADGTVGTTGDQHEVQVTPVISTGPTLVPREDFKMERRDSENARLQALRERADAYEAGGEKVPDHLARLLKEAEKAGGKSRRETRDEQAKPKATTAKTRDGKGFFYEAGHGVEPDHPDSTDEQGYHVPRPPDAPGADPLPAYATGDFDTIEPVEKYPDFANPHKKGDLVPEEAHARDVVPEHLKGKASKPEKAMEELKAQREAEAEKAHRGEPVDPEKALNPAPDPHQLAVAREGVTPQKAESPKKAAEETKAASKAEPKGATQSNKPSASNKPSGKK